MEITLLGIINDVNDEQSSKALSLIEVILLLKVISHGFSVHKLQQPLPLLLVQVAIIAPNAFRIMGNVGARVGDSVGDSVGDGVGVGDAFATKSDCGLVLQINLIFQRNISLSHLTSCHFPFEPNPNPVQAEEGSSPLPSPLSKFV